jgi:hypothetical protein
MKPDAILDDLVISQAHTAPARREADTNSPAQLASRETIQPWTGAALEGGRGDRHWLPRVDYLAAGGTIATVHDAGPDSGGEPTLTAETLARSLPGIDEVAELRPAQFMQRPSPSITFADLLRLRDEISMRIADGCAGVVITQGTDTIEETAFALDLLSAGSTPIVVTGAMRSPSLPGADGPANPCWPPSRSRRVRSREGSVCWLSSTTRSTPRGLWPRRTRPSRLPSNRG